MPCRSGNIVPSHPWLKRLREKLPGGLLRQAPDLLQSSSLSRRAAAVSVFSQQFNLRPVPDAPKSSSLRPVFGLFAVRNDLQVGW